VDPYQVSAFLDLNQIFDKLMINILVGPPQLLINFINVVVIRAFEIVEEWIEMLIEKFRVLKDFVFSEPYGVALMLV